MRLSFYRLYSPLSFLWKCRLAVLFSVLLLLVLSHILIYFHFTNRAYSVISSSGKLSKSETPNFTNPSPGRSALHEITGNLNVHVWIETCAKDINTLCNFPMFPKAPDRRAFANKTTLEAARIAQKNADGVRIFGFITPMESGLYFFMVKFCSVEVWLSANETLSGAQVVYSDENPPSESAESRVSSGINLIAGRRRYIEVVAACHQEFEANKFQVLWKTPTNSSFETIDGNVLSRFYNDSTFKDLKTYDENLPDSAACFSRRHQNPYFLSQREITYLSHDDVKDVLPYCEYKPSYTIDHEVPRFRAVIRHVVHTFVFPFPKHPKLRDEKNWIFPLDEAEASEVVNIFMEALDRTNPGKFELKEVKNVERKTDENRGKRYLIEVKLHDVKDNNSVTLSEYVFMPKDTKQLCYPENFQWNATSPVYLIVTAKNLGRWLHHFIKNAEKIFEDTNDPNFHLIIFDYNSPEINLEEVLKQSTLTNYKVLRRSGEYSRTTSFTEAIELVTDPHSIIFLTDLHLEIASPMINSIRKHCIEGRMVYTPIIVDLKCGANPANLAGVWQVYGYGLIGMYKSDWNRAGGFPYNQRKWGGEDWALVDALFGKGLEFDRFRTTHVYHYHHSKHGLW